MTENLLADLEARGLIHNLTDRTELQAALDAGSISVYYGIDPTADSIHIGNLIGVLVLRRFQEAGHRPIALVGGSTGMVGDPSGKADERNLLDLATLTHNVGEIEAILRRLLDFESGSSGATLVNNYDWTRDVTLLDFLRDVGKHATVNQMVAKDSVKSRMEGEHGISFTEFSYQLLQSFDFWWLHENEGCTMQIGGSDQWGNIVGGTDLIRRRSGGSAHALTWPLITRADGAKFGKTADGTVWLSADKTLPYDLHQYFLRVDDQDARLMLLQLTMLSVAEIDAVMAAHEAAPEARGAQHRLADEVTTLIHGPEAAAQANLAAEALFGKDDFTGEMAEALRGIAPETTVTSADFDGEQNLVTILEQTGLCTSRSDARRKLKEGQISINRSKVAEESLGRDTLLDGRYLFVQRGKKARHIVIVQ